VIRKKSKVDQELLDTLIELAEQWTEYENPNFSYWYASEDVSLPLALAHKFGYCSLTDKGTKALLECYNHLVDFANDTQLYEELTDLTETEEEIPARQKGFTVKDPNSDREITVKTKVKNPKNQS
jgi:hypothetical protein